MKKKVCFVVASEMTVKAFLLEQIAALSERYEVTVVANTANSSFLRERGLEANVVPIRIERAISPWSDFKALLALWQLFRREHFDIVHSVTPKAGLLGMLAGKLAGIRVRIHIFTGQVWATRHGFSRWLLKSMDRLLAAASTQLLADSASQRQFIINEGVTGAERIAVLGKGSISGVDVTRFAPDAGARDEIRSGLGLDDADTLFLFLGRINRDKGVLDLAHAFADTARSHPHAHLLIVGPDEEGLSSEIENLCVSCRDRIHRVDYTDAPQRYMAAAEVFCLPSYREGFGSVVIEAASVGITAIGSDIYGICDAIDRDRTGLLFPVGDIKALAESMSRLIEDAALRRELSDSARKRALADFDSRYLAGAWLNYYDSLK